MDSTAPKYLLINLNTIFDFSSITFALLKTLEEKRPNEFSFGEINLASFHLKTFDGLAAAYSNGDAKKKEELYNYVKTSELYSNVKPKLYILSQLYFLIQNGLLKSEDVYIYYEEKDFISYIDEKYFDGFKQLINIKNVVSYEELTTSILKTFGKEKVIHFGDKIFIDEQLLKLENLVIVENAKKKPGQVEEKKEKIENYFDSFDDFIDAYFSSSKEKYNSFKGNEFIMKYSHDQITKKFSFSSLWKNYTVFKNQILIEGKVIKGFKRGSKLLGIPTANIEMNETNTKIVTSHINGVYFGTITFKSNNKKNQNIEKKKCYKGVLSIGYNPFFNNKSKTIEVFLIDYDGEDFYEDEVSLLIDGYSRSEENFANLSELVTTITYDIILFNDILENMKK